MSMVNFGNPMKIVSNKNVSTGLIAALMAVFVSFNAVAVSPASAQSQGGAPVVKRVQVAGNQRIEADTIRSYLVIRPGAALDQQSLDTALKTLFATGLFEDVNITYDNGVLLVSVQENPIVNRVIFDGNKRTKGDKFTEEIQLAPRIVYTKAKVQSDLQRIIEVYRRTGRFAATVTPKIVRLAQNRVDVVFEIDEGPVTGVAKINFTGNTSFTSRQLRDVVLTAESRWFNFFESNDNYDPDRLEFDRELLRQYYTKIGYADFQVVSAIAELTPDRENFFINFQVEEGEKYTFGKITVKTSLDKVNGKFLERSLPTRTGEIFNSELIEKATESITFATGITGYAFVDVNPRLKRNPDNQTVDITFEVNEGPRVYVERINIGGNTRTLDTVVRREMRVVEGDAFNRVLIDRSRQRVNGLGFFGDVEIIESAGSAPDRTVLDVKVTEQSTGSFSVGAGISSTDNFIANVSIAERNLLGKGQFLQLDLRASTRSQTANLRFREPYFLDRNLAAGFDVFNSRLNFEESGFIRESVGGGLNLGFPVSEFGRLGLNYILKNDNVQIDFNDSDVIASNIDPFTGTLVRGANFTQTPLLQVNPSTGQPLLDENGNNVPVVDANGNPLVGISANFCDFQENQIDSNCESRGEFLTSGLGYTLSFNKLNNPFVPTRGWRLAVTQSLAGLGGDVFNVKSQVQTAYYRPLPFKIIGALKLDVGYVSGFNDDTVRIQDRFFRGAASFRGFEIAGVGPRRVRDFNAQLRDQALGARGYAVGSVEALLPLPLPESFGIRASLFSDFGTVGLLDDSTKALNNSFLGGGCSGFLPGSSANPSFCVDFDGDGIFDKPVQDDLSIRAAAGLSIKWRSPFGPVQIDISEAFLKEEYDRTESFRFSAGGQF